MTPDTSRIMSESSCIYSSNDLNIVFLLSLGIIPSAVGSPSKLRRRSNQARPRPSTSQSLRLVSLVQRLPFSLPHRQRQWLSCPRGSRSIRRLRPAPTPYPRSHRLLLPLTPRASVHPQAHAHDRQRAHACLRHNLLHWPLYIHNRPLHRLPRALSPQNR